MSFLSLFMILAFAFFAWRRLLRYLHMFQQEEYIPSGFLKWMVRSRAFDRRLSAALLALFVLRSFVELGAIEPALLGLVFVAFAFFERDPRKTAKKKLVMTSRAKRILGGSIIAVTPCVLAAVHFGTPLSWLVVVQLLPFSLIVGNLALKPYETRIQRRFLKEAAEKLAQINPTVIGITGSFGKTSVKHILKHIFEANAPTLATPGSVNTLMGISRILREDLLPHTRFFLAEMGAYGRGSIAKLCALTPPRMGVITALGEAHYERFKSLETVAQAKFELAEAVLSHKDGKIVVHESVLDQEYAHSFVEKNRPNFVVCGTGAGVDLKIGAIEQTPSGLSVQIEWKGKTFNLFAPLYGLVHASNLALAFATAVVNGIDPDHVVAAMRTTPQINHRLEVRQRQDNAVVIDDAYNSNPRGFEAALDLLTVLAQSKRRRILVTPGILELGDLNDEVHRALGIKAAQEADIVIAVKPDRIRGLIEGFRSASGKELYEVATFGEAQAWLREKSTGNDVILLENDLPDVNEAKFVV